MFKNTKVYKGLRFFFRKRTGVVVQKYGIYWKKVDVQ